MSACLDNPSFVNKVNPIAPLDTAQAMCDGDGRPSFGGTIQCVLDYTFAITVKRRGRLIKQEDSRIA